MVQVQKQQDQLMVPTTGVRLVSGGLAGCFADILTFPLDMAKVRLQVQGENAAASKSSFSFAKARQQKKNFRYRGVFGTIKTIVREEGPRGLYNGLTPGLQRQLCFCAVRIGLYENIKEYYSAFLGLEGVNIYTRIAAGVTSGGLAVIIAQPTDVVKVRLQAQGMHTSKPKRYTGAYHAYKTIFKEEGVKRGLWKEQMATLEEHIQFLERMCRLCGERVQDREKHAKGYSPKLCRNYCEKICKTFGVNLDEDIEGQHPTHICHKCHKKLYRDKKWEPVQWRSHPRTGSCEVCTRWEQQSKGGHPKKRKYNHPPDHQPCDIPFSKLSPGPKAPTLESHFQLEIPDELRCGFCASLSDEALESSCGHLFCLQCTKREYEKKRTSTCNICNQKFSMNKMVSPKEYLHRLMNSLLPVKCTKCKSTMPIKDVQNHTCLEDEAMEILSHPLGEPLTPLMEAIGSHIVKSKLAQSADGITASFQTRGQPIQVMHIPKARKSSSEALPHTVKKRSQILAKTREILSKGHSDAQFVHEVRSSKNLEEMLYDMNLTRVTLPKGEFLTVKADICNSWKKARELKRWLKQFGIASESEASLRAQQAHIINDNINAYWLPLVHKDEDGGTIIKRTPWVSVKSLENKVFQQLDGLNSLNYLKWNDAIPQDEIWLKIGGDKGGGNFKQVFQIGNVEHPNSPHNTIVTTIFPADDSLHNLKVGLKEHCQQLSDLSSKQWNNKKLRLFLFGDYEYLSKVYGLTGASGRHCCLWCNITKEGMKIPLKERGRSENRTLEKLQNFNHMFVQSGAKLSEAKNFYNVIADALFNIPIDQVCPPGLHLSLGLYLKHFVSFENQCHLLDVKMAKTLHHPTPESSKDFASTTSAYTKARQLDEEANSLDEGANILIEHITNVQEEDQAQIYHNTIKQHLEERDKLRTEAEQVRKHAGFSKEKGPLVQQLDETLKKFRVTRQAYHGKSFVGNHVHRCCKKENIDQLMSDVIEVTTKLCPSLVQDAEVMTSSYKTLFRLFGLCHKQYNTAGYVTDEDITALENTIAAYLEYFRKNFPQESVPPKMHILEDHVIPFMKKWKVGLGFLGEQGVESVHARLNNIKANIRGFNDDLAILKSMITTHWIQTRPAALSSSSFPLCGFPRSRVPSSCQRN